MAGSMTGCTVERVSSAPSNSNDIQAAFTAVQEYWKGVGLVNAQNVRLVTVGQGDAVDCTTVHGPATTVRAFDAEMAHYCPESDSIVVATRAYRDFIARVITGSVPERSVQLLVMAHEFGHVVEERRGHIEATDIPRLERIADCLGGQAIKAIDPAAATAAGAFYDSLATDAHHGTPLQRKTQFMSGFNGALCG